MAHFTILVLLAVVIAAAILILILYPILEKWSILKHHHEEIVQLRTEDCNQLYDMLKKSFISLKQNDKLFHSIFFSSTDYFNFKSSVNEFENRFYWVSVDLLTQVKEYIAAIDQLVAACNLNMNSTDESVQSVGASCHEILSEYQNDLLVAIMSDYNSVSNLHSFLLFKATKKASQTYKMLTLNLGKHY